MQYQRHEQPGCGGCLLLIILTILLFGGAPMLFEFMGLLLFGALFLFLAAAAAFFGFTYYIKRQVSAYEKSQTETHNKFVNLFVRILVRIAQVDGTVTRAEINTIQRFFQQNLRYTQNQLYWVKELIREAVDSADSLEELLAEFRQSFAYEPRLILLEMVYQVFYSNARVAESELQLARHIGEFLGINPYDRQAIEAKYQAGFRSAAAPADVQESRYYQILGLEPGAGFAEIKSAYRQLSMKYHPDKVGHLGDEFKKLAEEKMKELNVAYEYLKKKFNPVN